MIPFATLRQVCGAVRHPQVEYNLNLHDWFQWTNGPSFLRNYGNASVVCVGGGRVAQDDLTPPPANLRIINSVDKTIDSWSEERLECIEDANATQASRHVLSTLIQRVLYTSTDAALTRKPICW